MAKAKQFSKGLTAILTVICLLIGFAGGFYWYYSHIEAPTSDVFVDGALRIHFLELGNAKTGDCVFIQSGNIDILVDAGSDVDSIPTIAAYLDAHMQDELLDYVIVTHAHKDHYAGFATHANKDSLFDLYQVGTIIDFAMTNQTDGTMYQNYLRERGEEIAQGAQHYTAQECLDLGKSPFDITGGIELQILDSYYYDHTASSENDYSVCFMLNQDERHFLFTGDLEEKGEKQLVTLNALPKVTLYKAGHHGSNTSSCPELLQVIQPEIVCICCCAGTNEYTDNVSGQFPTQGTINNIAPYTDRIYITTLAIDAKEGQFASFNGNITVTSDNRGVDVKGSNHSTILRLTDWFAQNRTLPDAWKSKSAA